MFHLHNGDSAANIAKQTSLPGEHVAWRESLVTGPAPSGLSNDEWLAVRSIHLSAAYGVDLKQCRNGLLTQQEFLKKFDDHEEVVLWFEHDLFCQLHLCYLLDWFSQRPLGQTKLSLICIGEFPGREAFRGLGELEPDELASLFPKRRAVTQNQLNLAAAGWQAYCSADPTKIETFLQGDTSALPFVNAALRAHLQRFPSTTNGLGHIENRALQLIRDGLNRFSEIFTEFGKAEPVYGLGDAQFWFALRQLSATRQPLITISGPGTENPDQRAWTPEVIPNAKLELTEPGESVRKGEADFIRLNDLDLWLGGVHLQQLNNSWRWDERAERLVLT